MEHSMKIRPQVYIYNNDNVLTKIEYMKFPYLKLYAAMGYNGDKKGDLFVVECGPALVPCYDRFGRRINVGEDKAGMSFMKYGRTMQWRNE